MMSDAAVAATTFQSSRNDCADRIRPVRNSATPAAACPISKRQASASAPSFRPISESRMPSAGASNDRLGQRAPNGRQNLPAGDFAAMRLAGAHFDDDQGERTDEDRACGQCDGDRDRAGRPEHGGRRSAGRRRPGSESRSSAPAATRRTLRRLENARTTQVPGDVTATSIVRPRDQQTAAPARTSRCAAPTRSPRTGMPAARNS